MSRKVTFVRTGKDGKPEVVRFQAAAPGASAPSAAPSGAGDRWLWWALALAGAGAGALVWWQRRRPAPLPDFAEEAPPPLPSIGWVLE